MSRNMKWTTDTQWINEPQFWLKLMQIISFDAIQNFLFINQNNPNQVKHLRLEKNNNRELFQSFSESHTK